MTVETVAEPRGSSPDIRVGRPAGAESGFALVRPRGASPVVLRPATLADVDALGAMHRRCSPESRYRRYLVATSEVSPANVRWLLIETATTVAEAFDGQLVAMGKVALGGVEAEAALLVEDGWQRRGLGVCLAGVLAGQAVAAGARVLTATVFGSNVAIRRTMAAAGLAPRIVNCDAGTLELHGDLLHWSQPQPLPGPVAPGASVGSPPCPVNDHPVPRPCARPPPGQKRRPAWLPRRLPRAAETTGAPVKQESSTAMTTMVDHRIDTPAQGITVTRLREVISGLSGDTPLQIGVADNHHFNTLIGTLPITSAQVQTSPDGVTLIFYVPGVS